MPSPGDIISYLEMCQQEGTSLQRGMNYRSEAKLSVILMSVRRNAPYADRIEDNGRVLIYEGHDISKTEDTPIPKIVDQPMKNPRGTLTQNGLFYKAAQQYKSGRADAELVSVYEKLHTGIWVYNGIFKLIDAWLEESNKREVFKFKLLLAEETPIDNHHFKAEVYLEHNRLIPSAIKLAVWKRDRGKCVKCGSANNLHFDHIIPFSKGGSSLVSENIQLLCARHNLEKHDRIE